MSDLRTDRSSRPVPSQSDHPASPRKMITAVIALGAVAAFGIGIWFAYDQGVKRGSSGAPPLIRAEQGPTKVAPENPGGMQVPNQDKQIYERIGGGTPPAGEQTERLLPPPERPTATPTQPASAGSNVASAQNGTQTSPVVNVPMRPAANPVPNQTSAPSPNPVSGESEKTAEKPAEKPAPQQATEPQTAAAPATPPKTVASAGGSAKVQLASLKDRAAAQSTWTQLQKKYGDILGDLSPSYEQVEIPNKGTFVRLQAGPLKDRNAAQDICQKLSAKKQGCIVVAR